MPRKLIDPTSLPAQDLWLHDDNCAGRPVRAVLVEDIEKAEAVVVPQWIPVTPHSMPPEGIQVIAVITGKAESVYFDDAIDFITWYADKGWISDLFPDMKINKVTFWMILPDPPNVKERQKK